MKNKTFDIGKIAAAINVEIIDWPGNCYYIATACVKHGVIKGTPRYGHWLGKINPQSMFARNIGAGFAQHGWVEVGQQIFDPTRWVFEHTHPYIYFGENDFYDVGGSQVRKAMQGPPPIYKASDKQVTLNVSQPCHVLIKYLLCDGRKDTFSSTYSLNQLFWLGNCSPNDFGPYVREVYNAFKKGGNTSIIPIDNWRLVMVTAKLKGLSV